jgi:hypothetical protein
MDDGHFAEVIVYFVTYAQACVMSPGLRLSCCFPAGMDLSRPDGVQSGPSQSPPFFSLSSVVK